MLLSMAERKPYLTREPSNDAPLHYPESMAEYERQRLERDRKLGPEVSAADARSRAEYEAQRNVNAEPVNYSGRYEVDAWRESLKREAQFDAQGLSDDMPENPVQNGRFPGNVR